MSLFETCLARVLAERIPPSVFALAMVRSAAFFAREKPEFGQNLLRHAWSNIAAHTVNESMNTAPHLVRAGAIFITCYFADAGPRWNGDSPSIIRT